MSIERSFVWLALVCGLLAGGCYNPQVKNMGFACIATDDPPCPQGYFCVNGFCVDNPAQVAVGDDLSGVADMSFNDFASPDDLAKGRDLTMSAMPDLATGASCGMSGDQCITQGCCPGSVCLLIRCI